MQVSLLHHWLVSMRGGEKVLEQFCRLFPAAKIHTLVKSSRNDLLIETIGRHKIITTCLNRLPGVERYYKSLLPLYPVAIRGHQVKADFILSSDASMIKGMSNPEGVPHVCYCHSPPRYLWDMQDEYLKSMGKVKAKIFKAVTSYLREFDREAARNVDHFIANSAFVRERIKRIYDRESAVIHPPVALDHFEWRKTSEGYYLMVSALVPYKKVDLAVRAFNSLGKPLVIIGQGSEYEKLRKLAGDNVTLLGSQPFEELKYYYEHCQAFIFPGIEDFGITPLEAQASGKPVIAFRGGGALETVVENETGLFFDVQNEESLIETVQEFEKIRPEFSGEVCRKNAERFSPERFREEVKAFLIDNYPSYFHRFNWEGES